MCKHKTVPSAASVSRNHTHSWIVASVIRRMEPYVLHAAWQHMQDGGGRGRVRTALPTKLLYSSIVHSIDQSAIQRPVNQPNSQSVS